MKVTIDFGSEIEPAIQQHLEGGIAVKNYIVAAVEYFNAMIEAEKHGNSCGFGDKSRFKTYNTEVSPSKQLESFA